MVQNNDLNEGLLDFGMMQAEGNILTDLSGNGNNGTIYGAEWSDYELDDWKFKQSIGCDFFSPSEELQDNSLIPLASESNRSA